MNQKKYISKEYLEKLRKLYRLSVNDRRSAERLWRSLASYNGKEGSVLAYKAAAKAMMASYDWNPFNKYQFLQESMNYFEKAVSLSPQNIEIRFLRFAVQHYLPDFLGLSKYIEEDKSVLLKHLASYDDFKLTREDVQYIVDFLVSSKRYSQEELYKMKQKIAS